MHLMDLLAKVWQDAKDSEHEAECRYSDEPGECTCTNPYVGEKPEGITYFEPEDFINDGYLQEVNRQVLHSAGLAMEVSTVKVGKEVVWMISGVWDYRTDPEGMMFGSDSDPIVWQMKIDAVADEQRKHEKARVAILGLSGPIQQKPLTHAQQHMPTPDWDGSEADGS